MDLVGFRVVGQGARRELAGGKGTALVGDGKTPLGPRGSGFYSGNTDIQQNGGMYPSLSKSLK